MWTDHGENWIPNWGNVQTAQYFIGEMVWHKHVGTGVRGRKRGRKREKDGLMHTENGHQ